MNFALVNSLPQDTVRFENSTGTQLAPPLSGVALGARSSDWIDVDGDGASVRWVTDGALPKPHVGVSIDSFQYQRFEAAAGRPSWIPLRFPGQYFDPETGFHENRNRFYSPKIGRYLSVDRLMNTSNSAEYYVANDAYVYAGNNPLRNSDPTGKQIHVETKAQGDVVRFLLKLDNADGDLMRKLARSRRFILRVHAPLAPGERPPEEASDLKWEGGGAYTRRAGAPAFRGSERQPDSSPVRYLRPAFLDNVFYSDIFYEMRSAERLFRRRYPGVRVNEGMVVGHEIGHGMWKFDVMLRDLDPLLDSGAEDEDFAIRIEHYFQDPDEPKRWH